MRKVRGHGAGHDRVAERDVTILDLEEFYQRCRKGGFRIATIAARKRLVGLNEIALVSEPGHAGRPVAFAIAASSRRSIAAKMSSSDFERPATLSRVLISAASMSGAAAIRFAFASVRALPPSSRHSAVTSATC